MRNLAKSCACRDCKEESMSSQNIDLWNLECARGRFVSSISFCTADILAISLFEGPDKLLVSYDCLQASTGLKMAISNILKSGERTECTFWRVLAYALELVGHKDIDRNGIFNQEWVISCYKGQAVYPKVFETGNICQPGYLALYWAPGLLFFDGEVYDKGIGFMAMRPETNPVMTEIHRTVTEPLDLYPNIRLKWKVARRDGYLEFFLACESALGHAPSILSNLAHALVISCPHDRASLLHKPDPNARYTDLFLLANQTLSLSGTERQVDVIAVDGNTDLRMFAMSALSATDRPEAPIVIRNNACLQCCLDLCREAGSRFLIC